MSTLFMYVHIGSMFTYQGISLIEIVSPVWSNSLCYITYMNDGENRYV